MASYNMWPLVTDLFHIAGFICIPIIHSFVWLNKSVLRTRQFLFICLHIDGHLGCFHLLIIMNNATVNICMEIFEYRSSFLWGIYVGMELQCLMVIPCCYFFWKNCQTAFPSSCNVSVPTRNVWVFQFLHILVNTCYFLFFIMPSYSVGSGMS